MEHYVYNKDKFNLIDANNNNYTLTVHRDEDAESPRKWDNISTMICWHDKYTLGDKHNYDDAYDLLSEIYREIIDNEIEVYNYYLQGDVYGFSLCKQVTRQDRCPHCGEVIREYEDEEEIDTRWGFYGDSLEDSGILEYIPTGLRIVEE